MQRLRKRIHVTPATVIASLALVFAMTGGAYAASKYVITSTKQISPKVLRALKGKNGTNGASGANGTNGAAGAQGPQGPQGSAGPKGENGTNGTNGTNGKDGKDGTTGFTEKLPSGKTETGDWSISENAAGAFKTVVGSVSFNIPLASTPVPIYVRAAASTPEHCTGDVTNPGADAGYLCVFASQEELILKEEPAEHWVFPTICSLSAIGGLRECIVRSATGSADRTGFGIVALSEAAGHVGAAGTWAVTAE